MINANTLIAEYLEPNPNRPGPADWRVKGRGVSVWALIGYVGFNRSAVAL
jgi:hypothetical protein